MRKKNVTEWNNLFLVLSTYLEVTFWKKKLARIGGTQLQYMRTILVPKAFLSRIQIRVLLQFHDIFLTPTDT